MARLSFKPDSRFFRFISIGAVGARAVCKDLGHHQHVMVELENGSTDTKIWKDVKRKRVRIPDLICVNCGLCIECRAKTRPDLSMSHSSTDAERAWDYGMVDSDVIAIPVCKPAMELDWNAGRLQIFLRSASAWALGKIGTDKAIDRLVQAFSDVDQNIREEALEAITALGDPATEQLVIGLTDDNQDIAAGSAEAIRRRAIVPLAVLRNILEKVRADARHMWAVWLLGNLPHQRDYVASAIAELQDVRPEAHYAITVLWAFVESWIARHWELEPAAKLSVSER